jgi:hypothetical protein
MTGDHPTDWASKYVKAAALREAAQELRGDALPGRHGRMTHVANWLDARAAEIEQP